MISYFDFFAVVFAAGAVIEVWHKGSIFALMRAYTQALQDVTPHNTLKGYVLEWIGCPFCKSYHIPIYLFLLLLAGNWVGGILGGAIKLVIYGLAATRLGNIIDGLLPERMRYTQ
jgi:hypothetical protein